MLRVKRRLPIIFGILCMVLFVTTSLAGCSTQAETKAKLDGYGFTKKVTYNGVTVPVTADTTDEGVSSGSHSYVTHFKNDLDDSAYFEFKVKRFEADTLKDVTSGAIDDASTSAGWDAPSSAYFDDGSSWTDDGTNYRLYKRSDDDDDDPCDAVLIGNSDSADFAVWCHSDDDYHQYDLAEEVLKKVSFDADSTPEVDKSELEDYLSSNSRDQSSYLDQTWGIYSQRLQEAQDVINNDDATQDEVDVALDNLKTADQGLVPTPESGQYTTFSADWYNSHTDGSLMGFPGLVSKTFRSGTDRYLIVTVANQDASLSDQSIVVMPSRFDNLESYNEGDAVNVFGKTSTLKDVTVGTLSGTFPAVEVTKVIVY